VEVGGETKFACVDGPEFDGQQVNFDLLMKRQATYKSEEQRADERESHCRVGLASAGSHLDVAQDRRSCLSEPPVVA
jgi:ferredoxin--NADP+ reductase